MPNADSPTDLMESEALSARSYLELSHEAVELGHRNSQVMEASFSATPPEIGSKLRPRVRSRGQDPPPPDRPVRKRGRPRLETTKDAAAIEERRLQIRRAQRTYRQKKETTIQTLESRVKVLEQTLQNVSRLLHTTGEDAQALDSELNPTGIAQTKQLILAEINRTIRPTEAGTPGQRPVQDEGTLHDIFGYHVLQPHTDTGIDDKLDHHNHQPNTYLTPRSPSPLLNRLFPTTTIYTYSDQESNLSRRLQRFCLEHTYRWINDSNSDPALVSRVFGLVPCIHDMPGVRRAFRRALRSEIGSPLEGNKLPFYTLGNAGTHFPRSREDGEPIYPDNIRRPGKILRRLARILRRGGIQDWDEDWSGDLEPNNDPLDAAERFMSKEERLRALDLDGDWFDCHDVQGYLEQQGVVLDGSSLWLEVPAVTVMTLYGYSPEGSASQLYGFSPEESPAEVGGSHYISRSAYALDAECFFNFLLANMRILGRAPGFRVRDVDSALRAAIHRRPCE